MKTKTKILIGAVCGATLLASGCKKSSGPGGPGPGGGWLVGEGGLMAAVETSGTLGPGYDLGSEHDLLGIACRGLDTAFVVGEVGTFLRTFDGGATWEVVDLDTTRTLRSVAAAGETVYAGGDSLLMMSPDSGTSWVRVPVDPATSWLAVAAAHGGLRALALDERGTAWRHDVVGGTADPVAALAGARVVALSHDGTHAALAGSGPTILRTDDGGASWRSIDLGRDLDLYDAWATRSGEVIAVGADGVVVRIDATDDVALSNPGANTLRTLHINAQGKGVTAGDDGEVLMSDDFGETWTMLPLGLDRTVFAVDEVAGDGHL